MMNKRFSTYQGLFHKYKVAKCCYRKKKTSKFEPELSKRTSNKERLDLRLPFRLY